MDSTQYTAVTARSPFLTRRQFSTNTGSEPTSTDATSTTTHEDNSLNSDSATHTNCPKSPRISEQPNSTQKSGYTYTRGDSYLHSSSHLSPFVRGDVRIRSPLEWEGINAESPTFEAADTETLLSPGRNSMDKLSGQDDTSLFDVSESDLSDGKFKTNKPPCDRRVVQIAIIVGVSLLFVAVAVPPIAAVGLMYAFRPSHYTTTPEDCCGIPQIAYNDFELHPTDVRTGDTLTLQARFYNATAAPPVPHPDERITYNTTNNGHCIVVVHGHGSNQARWKANEISIIGKAVHPLVSAGFNVLTFDQRNHGKSEWYPPVSLGYYENYDVSAAIDWLLADQNDKGPKRCASGRVGLWGESMGGVVVLLAAARDDRVSAVVDESGFSSARLAIPAWINNKVAYLPQFMENQLLWWMQTVSPFSLDELEVATHLAKGDLSIPALLVHGTSDDIVPYDEGVSNYDSLYHSRHPHTNNTPPVDGPVHPKGKDIPWTSRRATHTQHTTVHTSARSSSRKARMDSVSEHREKEETYENPPVRTNLPGEKVLSIHRRLLRDTADVAGKDRQSELNGRVAEDGDAGLSGSKQLRLLFWTHVYGHVRAYLDGEYQITMVRFMEAFV